MANFNDTLAKLFGQLKFFWNSQSPKRKIIYSASLAGVLAVAILAAFFLNRVSYAVLYRDLDPQEAGEIMNRLDELKVTAQVDDTGTIMVPEADEPRLRMQLSSEGYPKTALNYDLFTNSTDFMTSDFEKRKYLIFQLQDRLQASIKTLESIDNAIVTISIPEQDSFVLEKDRIPASASVILQLKRGMELNKSQITGIEELVAKSVPGLESKNISIVDSTGTALNTMHSDSDAFSASSKMEMEKQASDNMQERILTLLEPIYGRSGISVAVNVVIDFNKAVSEVTQYNPSAGGSTGAVSKTDSSNVNTNGTGTGGQSGVPGTSSNTSVPVYQQSGSTNSSGYQQQQKSVDYLVSQIKEQIQKNGGEIQDMSVSVIIDKKELSLAQTDKLQNIVAYAAGLTPDKVSVQNMEFTANKNLRDQANQALNPSGVNWQRILIIAVPAAAVLLIGAVIFFILRRSRKKTQVRKTEKQVMERFAQASASRAIQEQQENLPEAIVLNETREQALKKQIKDFSSQNPLIVAQLLKTWLKEENDRNA